MIIILFIFHAGIFIKAKGHDTSQHVLACFGGAGRQINVINVCPYILCTNTLLVYGFHS